jgi:hypothetical protein
MALEQLDPQPGFQSVNVPDHGSMVNTQHLCCTTYGALACHLIRGAYLIPMFHLSLLCKLSHVLRISSHFVR